MGKPLLMSFFIRALILFHYSFHNTNNCIAGHGQTTDEFLHQGSDLGSIAENGSRGRAARWTLNEVLIFGHETYYFSGVPVPVMSNLRDYTTERASQVQPSQGYAALETGLGKNHGISTEVLELRFQEIRVLICGH
ncbi:unnamed protein product [Calypogeia fissa]